MHYTKLTVTAGRGFNHPHESFANFRFDLHLEAELTEDDDPKACLKTLQAQAEEAAEAHKKQILEDVERLRLIKQGEAQLAQLRRQQKQQEDVGPEIAKVEAALNELTSRPPILGGKVIHPGHVDHPETNDHDSFPERD